MTFIGLMIFCVRAGNFLANRIPSNTGIPSKMKTVLNISQMSMVNGMSNSDVLEYKLPHNQKLKGVIKTAIMVVNAVRLMDNAIFPFANEVIKLETFPPGQAATRIIPIATL